MQLRKLTIAGFRGFNAERVIDLNSRLSVISAPNSHGKTSISEALEFLIYGATSKVEKADSKEEYRNSYRNRHFPADKAAYIEAVFVVPSDTEVPGDTEHHLRVELDPDGSTVRRLLDGKLVEHWPFRDEASKSARPFVLQHALKYLLLVAPADRFQGFARLLGLNEADDVFRAIIGLCTKPTATLPLQGQQALQELSTLETRIAAIPELKKVTATLKRGASNLDSAYKLIDARADALLGGKHCSSTEERVSRLAEARETAAAKVYSGNVTLRTPTETETRQLSADLHTLVSTVDAQFLEDYGRLCIHGASTRLEKQAALLDIGVELLRETPDVCPLCVQAVDEGRREEIHKKHVEAKAEIEKNAVREKIRPRILRVLELAKAALKRSQEAQELRVRDLITCEKPENATKLAQLLGSPENASFVIIKTAASEALALLGQIRDEATKANEAISACEIALGKNSPNLTEAETLGVATKSYVEISHKFSKQSDELDASLSGPSKLLRQAVDALAGTGEISLLLDLIAKRSSIERGLRIRDVVDGLKELKRHVEQSMAELMEAAMSNDLTSAVMKWYSKIKTIGDPEVHFSGFSMDKTKSGEFKSRRLSVKAKSYGVELASAVSSLSESKLNALGLCVSIASAIRKPGPWSFLIIDDPIQSWDDEHETQFIDVIRNLIEDEGKQVLVLTHKGNWAKQVCEGCRSLNGIHYEMTGYTKEGPSIAIVDWAPLEQRIREADSIANDPTANSIRLQQAEEEIRIVACQLASRAAKSKLGRDTSPHNMNKNDVRAILTTAGIASEYIDRIQAMFVNADPAHHAPRGYQPNAQRIRQALASIREVSKQLG